MNSSFAFSGKERDLFIVALREMSDKCAAPELTPQCPFYELSSRGPVCAEQCCDLLAEHGRDTPRTEIITLGGGYEAARKARRHRRGPAPTSRPFDVTLLRLHDKDSSAKERHSVSLLSELAELFTDPPYTSPPEERSRLTVGHVRELTDRGFPADTLQRAMATSVANSASAQFIAYRFIEERGLGKDGKPPEWKLGSQWLDLYGEWLGTLEGNLSMDLGRALLDLPRVLWPWFKSLRMDDLISWPVPPNLDFDTSIDIASEASAGMWMMNRFLKTYLQDWQLSSLYLEWRYLHNEVPGCVHPRQMELRRIDTAELAKEIASRTVEGGHAESLARALRPSDFVAVAIEHLHNGRYEVAAAIYEAISKAAPHDHVSLNNFGFCLIPIDPERAVGLLEKAVRRAEPPRSITYANLAFAKLRLGDREAACEFAIKCREADAEDGAWLWWTDAAGELTLLEDANTLEYADMLLGLDT